MAASWAKNKILGSKVSVIPSAPAQPSQPVLVSPGDVPRRRLGSIEGRCALLHAIAHIEFNAINLALDMITRFGSDDVIPASVRETFANDWVSVADDEARHFGLVCNRLEQLGMHYGDLPAHNGLWEAAEATKNNIAARLAIAPLVLEARGLDVTPSMITKLERLGDTESAQILHVIYADEIGHVAIGSKWFHEVARMLEKHPEKYFKTLVKTYFKGHLKPPFNDQARILAGLPMSYYS